MVTRSLKYVESFLPEMIKSGEILLEPQEMFLLEKDLAYKSITSKQIQEKLEKFCKNLDNRTSTKSLELSSLLLDEIKRETPRMSVLEIMLQPFRASFAETIYKYEAEEIANLFWLFIKMQNKQQGINK